MFATLDLESNMSVLDTNNLATNQGHKMISVERENQRLGIKSRSRNGCLECKRKRKKCDENRPFCTRCLKSNTPCVWKENQFKIRKNEKSLTEKRVNKIEKIENKYFEQSSKTVEFNTNPILSLEKEILFSDICDFNNILSDSFLDNETDEKCKQIQVNTKTKKSTFVETLKEKIMGHTKNFSFVEINMNKFPSQTLIKGLNENEIICLDYYRTCVSQTISILPKESNFFLNLYLPLAESNKAILYALIGWAGVFLNSKNMTTPLNYIKKAIKISETEMKHKHLTTCEKIAFVSFYTILCAVLICAGDVKEWYEHFQTLHQFLLKQSNGELKNIKKYLGDSKELKWLISNFLYHDVLASMSHIKGTCFKMQEYCQILDMDILSNDKFDIESNNKTNNVFENFVNFNTDIEVIDNDMVCDSLQGCVRPIFVLIGEITNTFVDIKKIEKELLVSEKILSHENFLKERNKIYLNMENKYDNLKKLLQNTKPHTISLCYLKSDDDLELHLTLFEVYKLSASIYLKTLLKKVPPISLEIQHLVVDLLPCINIIIGSSVQASLCFPLLVAGISCISQSDRLFIREKVSEMSSSFPVKNFQRILVIIEEVWKINRNGHDCIHWFDISSRLGWDLSLA